MKVVFGCDEAGFEMKREILASLRENKDIIIDDIGCYDVQPVLYPAIAEQVAKKIQRGEAERGVLVCGTGIGMSVSANKVKGVRAAVGHDIFSVERSILSNNAHILCFGARVIAPQLAVNAAWSLAGIEFCGWSVNGKNRANWED